jgi:hypothetical protein
VVGVFPCGPLEGIAIQPEGEFALDAVVAPQPVRARRPTARTKKREADMTNLLGEGWLARSHVDGRGQKFRKRVDFPERPGNALFSFRSTTNGPEGSRKKT